MPALTITVWRRKGPYSCSITTTTTTTTTTTPPPPPPTTTDPSTPPTRSSSGYADELAWAASWLYKATGEMSYLDKAQRVYHHYYPKTTTGGPRAFDWGNKWPGVQLLLHKLTDDRRYGEDFTKYMWSWMGLKRTTKGLTYYSRYGANRFAANTAFLSLVAADYGVDTTQAFRNYGRSQVHYILGECCGGVDPITHQPYFSYIIGFGNNYPRAPYHRGASCRGLGRCECSRRPHPNVLLGAMVGGPDEEDGFSDDCDDYVHNHVAIEYNAGLTSAVAALKHLSSSGQLEQIDRALRPPFVITATTTGVVV